MLYAHRRKMLVRVPDWSAALVIQVCLVAISIAMTACGGGPSSNTPPLSQPVTVSVSPSSPSVLLGSTQQFTATVTGSSNTGVTWSVNGVTGGNATIGTISASGLYTAPVMVPSPNPVTVTATSAADSTKSASATVAITAPPLSVTVSPTSATVQTGATQQFTVAVTGTSNTSVTWSVNGVTGGNATIGTISASGLYTAPVIVPSTNPVTVKAASTTDSTKSASAIVTVTAPPPPVSVRVSPTSAIVQTGATQQFTVAVTGTSNTSVTWSVNGVTGGNATIGTISASGLYTTPASVPDPSFVTVTATSVADTGKSASAAVAVATVQQPVTVTVSPTSAIVQTGATQQFTVTVTGTSNTNVTWSVNGMAGGNATVGTISAAGLYTAPVSVPSPALVSIAATSVADSTKSGVAALTVTAMVESITQTISSANGGTITLPSGSSVAFPAGALTSDLSVTLALVTGMPQQPPSGLVVGVGPALVLSTAAPQFTMSSGTIQFTINYGTSSIPALGGSASIADLIDTTGDNFFGVDGSFDSVSNTSIILVDATLMNGTTSVVASMGNLAPPFGAATATATATTPKEVLAGTPPPPGQLSWTGAAWVPYAGCPAPGSHILVLTHGVFSSVSGAFSSGGPSCVNQIKANGGYDSVVGYEYDWTRDIGGVSGASFASFLNTLAMCSATIDIEAHSAGGPVVVSGILQASSQAQGSLRYLVGMGNPFLGSLYGDVAVGLQHVVPFVNLLLSGVLHHAVNVGSVPIAGKTIAEWRSAPSAAQLALFNNTFLPSIQGTQLHNKAPGLTVLTVCGNALSPLDGPRVKQWLQKNVGIDTASDGIVGVTSCQAGGPSANVFTNANVQYLPPYPNWHTQLECAVSKLQTDVGTFVNMVNACNPVDQTAHNNTCFAQYNNQIAVCNALPTLIQQGDCVNAAIHTYETCISYCTPP
jgi:Bacterial Ig-like domain (group 2)